MPRVQFRVGFQRETVYAVDGVEYRVCTGIIRAFTRDGEPFDPVAAGHWQVPYVGTVRCESGPPGAHTRFPPREVVAALSATERIPLVGARFDPATDTVVYDGPTPPLPVRVYVGVWEDPRYAALGRFERTVTDEELARVDPDPDAPYVPGTLARTVRARVDAWVRAQWPGVLPEPTPPVLDAAIPF